MLKLTQNKLKTSRGKFSIWKSTNTKGPVLFCHNGGPGMDSTYLRKGLPQKLYEQFQLIFFDPKGEGPSPCHASELNTSLNDYANDVLAIKEQLAPLIQNRKTGILGHSFGGFVAIQTLANHPKAFDFAILSNTKASFGHEKGYDQYMKSLSQKERALELEKRFEENKGTDQDFLEMCQIYHGLYYPEYSEQEAVKKISMGTFQLKTYQNFLNKIVPQFDLRKDCKKITTPTLIIGSEFEILCSESAQKELSELISNSHWVQLTETGHFPFFKKSDEYAKVILDWYEAGRI